MKCVFWVCVIELWKWHSWLWHQFANKTTSFYINTNGNVVEVTHTCMRKFHFIYAALVVVVVVGINDDDSSTSSSAKQLNSIHNFINTQRQNNNKFINRHLTNWIFTHISGEQSKTKPNCWHPTYVYCAVRLALVLFVGIKFV